MVQRCAPRDKRSGRRCDLGSAERKGDRERKSARSGVWEGLRNWRGPGVQLLQVPYFKFGQKLSDLICVIFKANRMVFKN